MTQLSTYSGSGLADQAVRGMRDDVFREQLVGHRALDDHGEATPNLDVRRAAPIGRIAFDGTKLHAKALTEWTRKTLDGGGVQYIATFVNDVPFGTTLGTSVNEHQLVELFNALLSCMKTYVKDNVRLPSDASFQKLCDFLAAEQPRLRSDREAADQKAAVLTAKYDKKRRSARRRWRTTCPG